MNCDARQSGHTTARSFARIFGIFVGLRQAAGLRRRLIRRRVTCSL